MKPFELQSRPFLKWAGNKYRIIHHIIPLLPKGKRLIEPFAGSAALFLNTDYDHYVLADSNPDLINLFKIIKKEGEHFIKFSKTFYARKFNREKTYYRLRLEFNKTKDPITKAALFLYLNRHGYNGLCRYSKRSGYNVPFGRYESPYFPEKELLHFHRRAKRATFKCADFKTTMSNAKDGDIIYCDPPYAPLSKTAYFTAYSQGGFNLEHQALLAESARENAANNIPVIISNHDTNYVRKLYQGARMKSFHVTRTISCKGEKRVPVREILALFDS